MRPLLLFGITASLFVVAPAQAQTCSDGAAGVRVTLSRIEQSGTSLRACFALAGNPALTVGGVGFRVYERSVTWLGGYDETVAPSVYNTAPYSAMTSRCLASPWCDDNSLVSVQRDPQGTPAHFTAEPAELICIPYEGVSGASGLAVREVIAYQADNTPVTACPDADQAMWGTLASSEEGPNAAALTLDVGTNPVRGSARVSFSMRESGEVRLRLFDALGREAAVLADGARGAGVGEATLDAGALAPGVYLLRLEAAGAAVTRTLSVVR